MQREDGSVVRQDGARNWRNNNPGNIEWKEGGFAAKYGAIGSDGRFAIFPSYKAGRAAKAALIFEGPNYTDMSLTDAIARYAPPSENNTNAYQNSVLAAVGGANKRMSDYTRAAREQIMDTTQKVEDFRAGKTTMVAGAGAMPRTFVPAQSPSVPSGMGSRVPDSVPSSIPALPTDTVPAPSASGAGAGRGTVGMTIRSEISENVSDRGIANV